MPSQDYEEFIAALNDHGVRYLVIGAHGVAFHARPRVCGRRGRCIFCLLTRGRIPRMQRPRVRKLPGQTMPR